MQKFPNQELERRFWRRRAVELARRDSQACLLLAFIYAGATLTFLFQSGAGRDTGLLLGWAQRGVGSAALLERAGRSFGTLPRA